MIEIVVASGVVGFVAAAGGSIVATAVQRNENGHITRRIDEQGITLALHTVQIQDITARKHCGPCDEQDELRTKQADERHGEMLERMKAVENTVAQGFKDFITTMQRS